LGCENECAGEEAVWRVKCLIQGESGFRDSNERITTMFKRMLLPAVLLVSVLGFGLTPKASAGWFRHDALERHQRLERNSYYGNGYGNNGYGNNAYGYSNNGYAYYGPGYSDGYPQNYNSHNNNSYYNNGSGSYRYNGGPSYSNGHNTGRQSGHGSQH